MTYLTKQEIFDKVANHLLAQNTKSVDTIGSCAYRGKNDLKCAVGVLIPDEAYHKKLEGIIPQEIIDKSWGGKDGRLLADALGAGGVDTSNEEIIWMLDKLQTIHDEYDPSEWRKELLYYATHNNLNTNALG